MFVGVLVSLSVGSFENDTDDGDDLTSEKLFFRSLSSLPLLLEHLPVEHATPNPLPRASNRTKAAQQ